MRSEDRRSASEERAVGAQWHRIIGARKMTTERKPSVLEGRFERDGRTAWLSATLLERFDDNTYRINITSTMRPVIGNTLRFGTGHESNACLLGFVDAVVVATKDADHVIEFAMTGPVLDEMLERLARPEV